MLYWERFKAMGLPPRSVVLLGSEPWYLPKLPDDAIKIKQVVDHYGTDLVILDSLSGGHVLDENSAEMRSILQVLAQLAAVTRTAVVVVHHTRKRSMLESASVTIDRVRGSSTITQFARSVIALWRWEEHGLEAAVRVEQIKNNLGKPQQPIGFLIGDRGLLFGRAPEEAKPYTALDEAVDFLQEALAEPTPVSALYQQAEAAGISKTTLKRARKHLNCEVYQECKTWYWRLTEIPY